MADRAGWSGPASQRGCSVVAIPPGWSGGGLFGFDGYFQAEFLELGDEAFLLGFRAVPAPHPFRAEVPVDGVVVDDVPVGDQNVVADRPHGFLDATAAPDLGVVRGQIGVPRVWAAACAASVSAVRSHVDP